MPTSDLSVFFRPRGVAVIGASANQEKLGYGVVRNLRAVHYPGAVYPVNPNEDEIVEYKAYPSIAAVPDPVDLAVILVPAAAVAARGGEGWRAAGPGRRIAAVAATAVVTAASASFWWTVATPQWG